MVIDLLAKSVQVQREGEESVEFGKGYVVHYMSEQRCSITYAAHTSVTNLGLLKCQAPCTNIQFDLFECKGGGEGRKEDLLEAIKSGKIKVNDPQPLAEAIEGGRVLYLPKIQGLLLITKKEGALDRQIEEHKFYTSTQREEAISDVIERIKKRTHHILSAHNLEEKDLLAIAAFISLQLP